MLRVSTLCVPYDLSSVLNVERDHLSDQVGFLFSANAPIPARQQYAGTTGLPSF
jgi:hypothetical protein